MSRRPWDEERDAAMLMCAQLGGVTTQVDTGGGPEQRHDFDLELPDGTTVAVEVTRHNNPTNLAVLSELHKRDWHFPQLRNDWIVDMRPVYNVGAVHREIVGLLLALETAGVGELFIRGALFDDTLDNDELNDDERQARADLHRTGTRVTAERLRDLGARQVYRSLEADVDGGVVNMGEHVPIVSTRPSTVVELVERHAALPDNVKKLCAAAGRTERHLFVWVETSAHFAVAAFSISNVLPDGAGLPDRAPTLPDCVDAVWAVTAYDTAHIWQYHRAHSWRDLGRWSRPEA